MGVSSIILALDSRPYSLDRLKKKKTTLQKITLAIKKPAQLDAAL